MKIGPGHEQVAKCRIDENNIDKSVGQLQMKEKSIQ